jgi:subtilisin-like proprotein convertase family protein
MRKTNWKKAWLASAGCALLVLALGAAGASAETITVSGGEEATIPSSGKAEPYPSLLDVQGGDGNMTDVNVTLTLTHPFPTDLDIAIVSPDGDSEILMSDACGEATPFLNTTITFDSEAGTPLSTGPCTSGTFQPTNFGAGDTWEGGPSVTTNQLANLNGEDPNGTWQLFIVDDLGGGSGTLVTWSLTIKTETAEVIVPATGTAGIAKPYPSTKSFNTPAGKVISDLNFETPDFNHTFPDDVDMLLAGPRAGAKTILMSDACGATEIHDYKWIFDDEALAPMTDATLTGCNPFVIKPTDFEPGDKFPPPAPAGPYPTSMAAFDGLEGGAFSLFVNDDVGGDTGFLTSWTLIMTTRDAADTGFAASSTRVEEGGKAVLTVTRTGQANLGPATLNVSTGGAASAGADYTAPAGTLEFARGQSSKTFEIPIANDSVGEATERFNVVLSSPRDDARLTGTTSAEVIIGPDNEIKFGKLKRNKKKGTAKLFVNVPGPGTLVLSGEQVKKVKKTVKKAGKVGLPIKPKGNAVGLLQENGKAKLRAKVAFTPTDGTVFTKTKKLKLLLEN